MSEVPSNVPQLMSYEAWMRGTGMARVPGGAIEAIDIAFKRFDRTKSIANFASLKHAFLSWIALIDERQGNWRHAPQNKDGTIELLNQQIRQWDEIPIEPVIRLEDRIHTRLGLVYLFSHLRVTTTSAEVLTEALISATTLGLGYQAGSDQAVLYAKQGVSASKYILPGVAAAVEGWARAERPAAISPSIYDAIPKEAPWRQQLEMGYRITRTAIADALRNALKSITDVFNEKLRPFFVDPMGVVGSVVSEKLLPFITEATATISALIEEKLKPFVDDLEGKVGSMAFGQIRPAVEMIAGGVSALVLPWLSSAWDLVKGIVNSIDAGIDRYRFWIKEHIHIANGHPSAIMQSIRQAMNVSLGDGLLSVFSGSVRLTTEVLTAGAGKIVTLVLKMVEILARAFVKIAEIEQLNRFVREARRQWEGRESDDALHKHADAFDQWYRGNALTMPLISVLSLNSGLAGDKTQFLAGLSKDRAGDFEKFAEGVQHVDSLKAWGVCYLNKVRIGISGTDAEANGYLAIARGQVPERTFAQQAWQATLDGSNGRDYQMAQPLKIPGATPPPLPVRSTGKTMIAGRTIVRL